MKDWVVGIDLGATKIALGLIDPTDRIVGRRRMPTDADGGPQPVVERIAGSIAELEKELPRGQRVAAIGMCSPGPVDHQAGIIIDPPNLPGLHHSPFRQLLADRLNLPVNLEHDAKAAALGEYYYGAGRGARSMVFLVVGTGVGAAMIVDGQLYRGARNLAGEVGHITLDRHGTLCNCGSRGCVETYAAGSWLAYHYQVVLEQAGQGHAAQAPTTGEQVARLAEQGDTLALQVMADAGDALGAAVATLAMILDIDLYVVGGSVAKSGDLLLEPARRGVSHYSHGPVSAAVRILATQLGDDGPILGCGWQARQLLLK